MRYPTLPRGTTAELAIEFLETGSRELDDEVKWEGQGRPIEPPDLVSLADEMREDLDRFAFFTHR